MNKHLVLLSCFLLVSVAAYAQYPYKWQIGGTMGMGGTIYTDGGAPTMSMTIGFNKAVHCSCVKPGKASSEKLYIKLFVFKINFV